MVEGVSLALIVVADEVGPAHFRVGVAEDVHGVVLSVGVVAVVMAGRTHVTVGPAQLGNIRPFLPICRTKPNQANFEREGI